MKHSLPGIRTTAIALLAWLAMGAHAQSSPAEEFEAKMAPYKRAEFLLPAAAGVRVFDAGRRESPENRWDDSTKLRAEIRKQADEEKRLNNTYSHPDIIRPQPKTLTCEGILCTAR